MPDDVTATQINDFGPITTNTWTGTITATDPSAAADTALEQLGDFYVAVDKAAPIRCIDGRPNPDADEAHLGAQLPGGTPGAALAGHFAGQQAATLAEEAKVFIDKAAAHGFIPGDHRDEHSANLPTCGCGAIDKMDLGLQALIGTENSEDLRRLVGALLGESFDDTLFQTILAQARELAGQATAYFENRSSAIDYLESCNPLAAPVLRGVHNEYYVIVNTVPDTTFATNRFAETFGIQAFGYDFWATLRDETELVAEANRPAFIMARAMTAIATLMVLTDGSQRLIVRA